MIAPQLLHLSDYTDEMLALDELSALDDGEWTETHEALSDELLGKLAKKLDSFWLYRLTLRANAERAQALSEGAAKVVAPCVQAARRR